MARARRIILTLTIVYNGSIALLAPIYAIFVEKIGGGILDAAGTYALFTIVYGILMIFIGKLTDKVQKKEYFMAAGFFFSAIGFAGYLVAKNIIHLLITQIILGIAFAVITPASDALYTSHLDKDKYASQWGIWETTWYVTEGVCAFIGGIIAKYIGFHALFISMITISCLAGSYIILLSWKKLLFS